MVWSFDRTYGKPVVYSGVPNVHEVRNVIDKILRSRTYTGMLNTRYVVVVAGQCIGTPEYVVSYSCRCFEVCSGYEATHRWGGLPTNEIECYFRIT